MTIGVGLFGTITAFLANIFIVPGEEEPAPATDAAPGLAEVMAQLEEVKTMLQVYEHSSGELSAKIEKLETVLTSQE